MPITFQCEKCGLTKTYVEKCAMMLYKLTIAFFILYIVAFIIRFSPYVKDDSAPSGWGFKVSGMTPTTDAKTGCQYLLASNGITPRMDASGKQICEGR